MAATRIAILNSHPVQYFAPLYAFLNAAPDLDVTAIYLSDTSIRGARDPGFGKQVRWDIDLLAGYRSILLGNVAAREPGGFWSLTAPEVWNEIRSGRYEVLVLHGHNYAANHIALAAAKFMGLPVFMRGETHLGLVHSDYQGRAAAASHERFYRLCDRFLAIGTANATFYRAMGVPEARIFIVPYSVDNDRFMTAAQISTSERGKVREQLVAA